VVDCFAGLTLIFSGVSGVFFLGLGKAVEGEGSR
jgi:hypothetical protein